MNIWDNVGKSLDVLTQEARKTYGAKKLELRIKSYRKEETELYTKLGRLVYQNRSSVNDSEFETIHNGLETIQARMKHLDKQITDIRSRSEEEYVPGYLRLDRKESDLTIARTNEGIKLIRPCPACKTANSPDDDVCVHCGRPFAETEGEVI